MSYSIAFPEDINKLAINHLLRNDAQEDLCFALWKPSSGSSRKTALIHELILPRENERLIHGNASFLPQYIERVIGKALETNSGIAFMHSHLGPGWQDMSYDDYRAEYSNAPAVFAATGLPFVGLTLGTDGAWSGRFWNKNHRGLFQRNWCQSVRVVGTSFSVTFMDKLLPIPKFKSHLKETVSPWKPEQQAKLSRLRVGIIGTGSVGSIVGEAVSRIGVKHIKLIDFDTVELRNLGRLLHATLRDVKNRTSKVSMLAKAYKKIATAEDFQVSEKEWSIVEVEGFQEALDCDVLLACVDRPWPRQVLNFIAYAHLIPVIDVGIAVNVNPEDRNLLGADWKAQIIGPGRQCLECSGQYNAGFVSTEREGHLEDPRYIQSLPKNHTLRQNENVFAFSLAAASLQVLQFLSLVISPLGISDIGQQNYHFVTGRMDILEDQHCKHNCLYPSVIALGDFAGFTVTGKHNKAELARKQRKISGFP
ncbi:ThiF family protein [uncultured archaeon]|nr:ThiF family protein [uncultured archaeon]